jgi:hypothetical protein
VSGPSPGAPVSSRQAAGEHNRTIRSRAPSWAGLAGRDRTDDGGERTLPGGACHSLARIVAGTRRAGRKDAESAKHHDDDQAPGGQAESGDSVVLHGQHERPAEEQLSIFERIRELGWCAR